ncbi:hypothetical protein C8Q80DRAFT_1275964 [Daedaleopsis nitida]|nr:hypothetical protein C8Q80DRAFT_1275964 [Daedaleopsis nitida]
MSEGCLESTQVTKNATEAIVTRSAQAQSVGFLSDSQLLDEAVHGFERSHSFAFRNLAKALVMRHGPIEWTQTSKRVLHFKLQSITSLESHPNPARTFELASYTFTTLDELLVTFPEMATDWTHALPARDRIAAHPDTALKMRS